MGEMSAWCPVENPTWRLHRCASAHSVPSPPLPYSLCGPQKWNEPKCDRIEKQAENSEEQKRELGQLEGDKTQACWCPKTNNGHHCARAVGTQTCSILFCLYSFFFFFGNIPKYMVLEETGGEEWHKKQKRKGRLAMIFWCESARQSACSPRSQSPSQQTSQPVHFIQRGHWHGTK